MAELFYLQTSVSPGDVSALLTFHEKVHPTSEIYNIYVNILLMTSLGGQWLRGRVLDSRPRVAGWSSGLRGSGFKHRPHHCVVEGVDRGGGGTGIEGAESRVEGAESGVEGAGSRSRGGGKRGNCGLGSGKIGGRTCFFLLENS